MREIARWLYETIPGLSNLFPAPWLFLLAFYALVGLIVVVVALWLFWKWFHSGLDGIPDPVHPVIQRVVVVHEHRHIREGDRD